MAYNGKYVSVDRIIENVYRDFKFEYDLNYQDAVEWIGSLLALLSVPIVLLDKVTNGKDDMPEFIKIENYRGNLPCDLHSIVQTAYAASNGTLYPMYYTENTMHRAYHCSFDDFVRTSEGEISNDLLGLENSPLFIGDSGSGKSYAEYKVNNNYIFTNFREGFVQMSYKAIPTDSKGMPLIPDNESWIRACVFEVALRIASILYYQDKLSVDKLNRIDRDRDWYVGQAVISIKIPSLDQQQSEINNIRSINKRNHHGSFFRNMTIPETRYNSF